MQNPSFFDGRPVVATVDALVIRVLHGQEGDVRVRIGMSFEHLPTELHRARLAVPSGRLVIGNVMRSQSIDVGVSGDECALALYVGEDSHFSQVDIVMDPA